MIALDTSLLLAASIGGFGIVLLLIVSSERFLKGEIKRLVELLILGALFLYLFALSGLLINLLGLEKTLFGVLRNSFVYLSLIFFILATSQIYELSKVFGFASKKIPKKLKRLFR